MNEKQKVPVWVAYFAIPPFAFIFVFGAVFGGMAVEARLGTAAAFMFVPLFWGGLLALAVQAFRSLDWQ